jgi:hypothetical protein
MAPTESWEIRGFHMARSIRVQAKAGPFVSLPLHGGGTSQSLVPGLVDPGDERGVERPELDEGSYNVVSDDFLDQFLRKSGVSMAYMHETSQCCEEYFPSRGQRE